jgi:hypothetical protein
MKQSAHALKVSGEGEWAVDGDGDDKDERRVRGVGWTRGRRGRRWWWWWV